MKRLLHGAALIFALLAPALQPPSAASLAPRDDLKIVDLRVDDSQHSWSADNNFQLSWSFDLPERLPKAAIVAVNYRVLDANMKVVIPAVALAGAQETVVGIRIPPGEGAPSAVSGEYTAQVWLETQLSVGPPTVAKLRFDDRRPGAAIPQLPGGWVRGDAEPLLRISPPPGPQPASGIRGYAVAVRAGSAGQPCAGPDRCTAEETDLRGGIADDRLVLGVLAEGAHVVSVVAVSNSGMRSAVAGTAEVRVDATRPDLELSGSDGGWSNRPVRILARATDALSGMDAAGPTGPRTTIAVDGGTPVAAQGDEAAIVVATSGVHSIAASARDAAGNVRGEDGLSPALTGVVRIDEATPTVSFSRGGEPGQPELIEATVGDDLSGAAGRGTIGLRPLGSGKPFEPLPTSSHGGRLTAHWDSDAYPEGAYEFQATGYDRAGNAASSASRADGTRMVMVNPIKVPAAIRFGFGGRQLVWQRCVRHEEGRRCQREVVGPYSRRPAQRTVPYGQGHRVSGRLVAASGAPLAGFEVELVESFAGGGAVDTRATRVRTDADGVFFARLAPGPSRVVAAHFAGSRQLTRSSSRSLRLAVQSSVRLRASTANAVIGGAPVVFSGRVAHLDAAIPAYGRPVQLQFRLPGMPWSEFRTVQTDAQGRFRYPYSFSDDDSRGIRFLFRAYVPPQPGWPYEPAASRPVAVTGY